MNGDADFTVDPFADVPRHCLSPVQIVNESAFPALHVT
jgi:hypothetical protein